jgi:hypothetical protein
MLRANAQLAAAPRPPPPARWPRLEKLTLEVTLEWSPGVAALKALGSKPWARLRTLRVWRSTQERGPRPLRVPAARVLGAALRRMPALHELGLTCEELPDAAAAELFRPASEAPRPSCARSVSTAQHFRPRRRASSSRPGGGTRSRARPSIRTRVSRSSPRRPLPSAWPLEDSDIFDCNLSGAAGCALARLSRHARLRKLQVRWASLGAAGFKAIGEAAWPALTTFTVAQAVAAFEGPSALGAAFAGFPRLEELTLMMMPLGEPGAQLLAIRRWPRLRKLSLRHSCGGGAGEATLARGQWPELELLNLRRIGPRSIRTPLSIEDVLRWAPACCTVESLRVLDR